MRGRCVPRNAPPFRVPVLSGSGKTGYGSSRGSPNGSKNMCSSGSWSLRSQ